MQKKRSRAVPPGLTDLAAGFVAIDFETANYHSSSACSIGLAVVRGGEIADTFTTLIKPEPFWFVPYFTELHGISEADVEDAKDFGRVWPEIEKRIRGRRLVAHNAPFDRSVLNACLKRYGIIFPQPEFVCTVRMTRAAFPDFPNHKLNTVCGLMDIELRHHQADSDALACARIALKVCAGNSSVRGLLKPTCW